MRRSRCSEEQIIGILKEHQAGARGGRIWCGTGCSRRLTHPLLDLDNVRQTGRAPTRPWIVKEYSYEDSIPDHKRPTVQIA